MYKISVSENGLLSCEGNGKYFIEPSPIGILIKDSRAYAPISARICGEEVAVDYACGSITLSLKECSGYYKLTVISTPEDSETFIFGPYKTGAADFGEILGAAWYEDGSVACIQSLMTKVEGGINHFDPENDTGIDISRCTPAAKKGDTVTLQCCISDHSKERIYDIRSKNKYYHGPDAQTIIPAIEGPDAKIEGASIALITAESADALLDIISDMEIAEGLPHPMLDGEYMRKNKKATSIYLILSRAGLSAKEKIALAERAGASCLYLSDLWDHWGHFTINERSYPGGADEVKELSELARSKGLKFATHNLSNFITTNDEFVTPIPSHDLLTMDKTELTGDVSDTDTTLYIKDVNNYEGARVLNSLRIDDEVIVFKSFDKENMALCDCQRGAYGTTPAPHAKGSEVYRLQDHGYKTLFPNLKLQREMADNLANALIRCGIDRTSFDGLEGCIYTGLGEYPAAEFVKQVYDRFDNTLMCDASISTNYIWHMITYANWGEPWYDSARRGGMHFDRERCIEVFKKNLMFRMFGWYYIQDARGKFEATTPENMEFMLSRCAAFDAGIAVRFNSDCAKAHGKIGEYMDYIRLWEDFRFNADIPTDAIERMQESDSNWHLEKDGEGWILTQLSIYTQDLDYGDQNIETEAGMIYQSGDTSTVGKLKNHSSVQILDHASYIRDYPIHFRIRVGQSGHGAMKDLEFYGARFEFLAEGGDYLEYKGADELYHYDQNFNLKEVIKCTPVGFTFPANAKSTFHLPEFKYATAIDDAASYIMTVINPRRRYYIKRKEHN